MGSCSFSNFVVKCFKINALHVEVTLELKALFLIATCVLIRCPAAGPGFLKAD